MQICEEHGGATMKAAIVTDAFPEDDRDSTQLEVEHARPGRKRTSAAVSPSVTVKLSTAGVPKGSDAWRAAADAPPLTVRRGAGPRGFNGTSTFLSGAMNMCTREQCPPFQRPRDET